jgi:hypothetical protein
MTEPQSRQSDSPETIDGTCPQCNADDKGTYRTESHCLNCKWYGETLHSLGHEAVNRTERCPRCDCRTIYHGAYVVVADGDLEAMRRVPS